MIPPIAILLAAALAAGGADSDTTKAPRERGRFVNPHAEAPHGGFFGYLRARLFGGDTWASYDPGRDGPVPVAEPQLAAPGNFGNARVTWIGHSTVLIQHRGVNVLTDPILTAYASPVSFAGPRRKSPAALTADELPRIDVVVISHNHYDHLDAPTIRALGDGPRYFAPLGLADWLIDQGIDASRIVEMDWWDHLTLNDLAGAPLEVSATPSQHFSGRSLTDRNETLWAAWAIRWEDFAVWFGGDTGYNDVQFKEIGERLGGFDLGIIPIGAYLPRWFMRTVHVDPGEAVRIHRDIRARRSIGVHWGTFELAAEHLLEPPQALRRAVEAAGLPPEAFSTFAVGESRSYPAGG